MKKVVVIGGGTGSPVVLRALKRLDDVDIVSVTTAFDNGGSSRELRDQFGVLPPGDIRRCLVALSDGEGEQTLRDLFAFRFDAGGTLNGHSFGNLLLTALARMYGSDIAGIKKASEILKVHGTVLPVSLQQSHLVATFENGLVVKGETEIDIPTRPGDLHITDIHLEPEAHIYDEVADAIASADLVVFSAGDLYTTIIPNVLVVGMKEALKTSKAKKVIMINLMTKWGETHAFVASDFARELAHYSGIPKFDYALCDNGILPTIIAEAYAKDKQFPVVIDNTLAKYAREILATDISMVPAQNNDDANYVRRHDPVKLAKILTDIIASL
jgi:uncharacterized cofD-like protein